LDADPTLGVFFMTKYSEPFRQQLVDEFLAGGIGTKALAALSPGPRGRPRKMTTSRPDKPNEETAPDSRTREELLKENEFLRAEVAYLKKLDALLEAKKRAAQKKKRKQCGN
jgi:transposase-like protein